MGSDVVVTGWHPEIAVVGLHEAHVYLVPDNGSLSRVWTVTWDGNDPSPHHRAARTVHALEQLFRQVDVPAPDHLHDLALTLWARLDRRKRPAPPV